jgi:hypothetical protein
MSVTAGLIGTKMIQIVEMRMGIIQHGCGAGAASRTSLSTSLSVPARLARSTCCLVAVAWWVAVVQARLVIRC